ncbi:MAG: filament integrity protein FraC [Prochlorotrichaceae cyanobacterium]|jgi:hypothetical protein
MLDFLNQLNVPLVVLPLRAIVLQGLMLLVTIAIEAQVMENKLGLSPRGSVQFSTLLNLVSTVGGWCLFLAVENLLPETGRLELINYIFFDDLSNFSRADFIYLGLPLVLSLYILTFILESQILNLLMFSLASQPKLQYQSNQVQYDRQRRYKSSWTDRFRMNTLLIANAYSYTAVVILLLVTKSIRAGF